MEGAETVRLIRIFVSSPGDVAEERRILDEAVEFVNDGVGSAKRVRCETWKWEDELIPQIGPSPQDVVDAQTPHYDIYIGIMSTRFGTPTAKFGSGTEKEFRDALARWGDTGSPWISFYFNDDPPLSNKPEDVKQYLRVCEFREELQSMGIVLGYPCLRGERRGFYEQIAGLLTKLVFKLTTEASVDRTDVKPTSDPSGWPSEHLQKLEQEFISHMTGMDDVTAEVAAGRYVELLVEKHAKGAGRETTRPLAEYVSTGHAHVVLGEGGAGKTTSLLKLAHDAARVAMQNTTAPIPVYAKLNFFDTETLGLDRLLEIVALAADLNKAQLLTHLDSDPREMLILLDGFNEVRTEYQSSCALALEELFQRGRHRYVITSRPVSQLSHLVERQKTISEYTIVQLSDEQVQEFVGRHGAENLYEQMGTELRGLTRNPFLLWALARSCAELPQHELPKNKGELYRNLIDDYFFNKREREKEPSPTRYNYELVKKPILAMVALRMTQAGVTRETISMPLLREIHARLQELRARHEGPVKVEPFTFMPDPPGADALLVEAVGNSILRQVGHTIEYMHQSVQDYFAAVALSDWDAAQVIEKLAPPVSFRHFSERSEGFEAIVMLAGLKESPDALLECLMDQNPLLAAHCLAAASQVGSETRRKLIKHWTSLLYAGNEDYRILACDCFAIGNVMDEAPIEAIVEIVAGDSSYELRGAANRVIRQYGSAIAIEMLVERGLSESDPKKAKEIGNQLFKIDSDASVRRLFDVWVQAKQDDQRRRRVEVMLIPKSSWDKSRVLRALRAIRLDSLRHGCVDAAAEAQRAFELVEVSKPEGLPSASEVRKRMHEHQELAESLPRLSTEALIGHLRDRTWVVGKVADELAERGATEAVAPLVDSLLLHYIPANVERILAALDRLDRERSVQVLQGEISGENVARQTHAAVALASMGALQSFDPLYDALRYANEGFRVEAAKLLGIAEDGRAERALLEVLDSEKSENVVAAVLRALGNFDSPDAIDALFQFAVLVSREPDGSREALPGEVARSALVALIGPDAFAARLLDEAGHADEHHRARAVARLAELRPLQLDVSKIVRRASEDPSPFVRTQAVYCFPAESSSRDLADFLTPRLKDPDPNVRASALERWVAADLSGAKELLLAATFDDSSDDVRRFARSRLRGFTESVLDDLAASLEGDDAERRVAAIETLGQLLGNDDYKPGGGWSSPTASPLSKSVRGAAIKLLTDQLEDQSPRIRKEALMALGKSGNEEWKDGIVPLLVDRTWNGETVALRGEAYAELKLVAPERFLDPIEEALDDPSRFMEIIEKIGVDEPFLPQDAYLYGLRGFLYLGLKQYDKAYEDASAALKLENNTWYYLTLTQALGGLGRNEEAYEAARAWVELATEDPRAQGMLGWCAYLTERYPEAIEASETAVALDPKMIGAALNAGLACLADHRTERALEAYELAVALCHHIEDDFGSTLEEGVKDIQQLVEAKPELAPVANDLIHRLHSG